MVERQNEYKNEGDQGETTQKIKETLYFLVCFRSKLEYNTINYISSSSSYVMATNKMLTPRHTQEHTANDTELHYWAYPSRVWPCNTDKLNCIYLDAVYSMQTHTTLYSTILWAILAATLAIIVADRCLRDGVMAKTLKTFSRRYLLRESPGRWLFGRVTRVQVMLLLVLSAYLFVFT